MSTAPLLYIFKKSGIVEKHGKFLSNSSLNEDTKLHGDIFQVTVFDEVV